MKISMRTVILLPIALFLQSCVEETAIPSRTGLTIIVGLPESGTNASQSTLYVNIQNDAGEQIEISRSISTMKFANEGLAFTADLPSGVYRLQQSILVTEDGDITHALPLHNTLLNGTTKIVHGDVSFPAKSMQALTLELLDVRTYKAADFGLRSFKMSNTIKVIIASEKDNKRATPTHAYIIQNNDTIDHYLLTQGANQIAFSGDANTPFLLTVTKQGHAPFKKSFTINEWNTHKNKPLKVTLIPALTMVTVYLETQDYVFTIVGTGGSIHVDWGDGTVETYELMEPAGDNLRHVFPASGDYAVSITGDLQNITEFSSYYGQAPFRQIDFSRLINVTQLGYGLTNTAPALIDLTHNTKLQRLDMTNLTELETLLLPSTHDLSIIAISGPNMMSAENVNDIIANVYHNAVEKNITNGQFYVHEIYFDYPEEGEYQAMLGPPSQESIDMLFTLMNDYGWYVQPRHEQWGPEPQE